MFGELPEAVSKLVDEKLGEVLKHWVWEEETVKWFQNTH